MSHHKKYIGFACAYTPLSMIHAAGFTPYRVLPQDDCPDQAGLLLHDNMCPHVKGILDRAMSGRLPELHGMVFMNSCDAMRRLYDAWKTARPDIRSVLIDLPMTVNDRAVDLFCDELRFFYGVLESWGGDSADEDRIRSSNDIYNDLAGQFSSIRDRMKKGEWDMGSADLQDVYNRASCEPPEIILNDLKKLNGDMTRSAQHDRVPVFLFGNMLPNPAAFSLFDDCGAMISDDDLCTGSRLFCEMDIGDDVFKGLAERILNRPPCARTFDESNPGRLARDVVKNAKACGAKGVIGYTVKFCDPYIGRLPYVREMLRQEGIPFLFLEGDCTMRSIGQQRTRIEAFIEMLR
jgi:benzoyl-CoA reductase/2-hydroxyglutaryl-CoA dehydratase subunit BcrC/BadD/HgdB